MNIDIEAIVREEVRSFIRENLIINNVPNETVEVTVNTKRKSSRAKANIVWEFAPASGRRRTPEEMVLHKLEKKHGRLLTPEEKGEARATSQIAETTENDVREAAIKKDRIDKIAAEGMAAATKELAKESGYTEEELLSGAYPENPIKELAEEEIENPTVVFDQEVILGGLTKAEHLAQVTRIQEGMDKHDVDGETAGLNSLIVKEEPEATIPKTEELKNLDSLFS